MKIDKHASIVDVRTPEEFAVQHFPGAVNIPLGEIAIKLNNLKQLPKPVIFYCHSGTRSGMAVSFVRQNGMPDAVNGGGLQDLIKTKEL